MELTDARPYQTDCLSAIASRLAAGVDRQAIKKPTGTGKTVTFALLPKWPAIQQWLEQFPERERRILVIAHREELLEQAAAKIQAAHKGLFVCIDQGDRRASIHADVVVASIQSLAASDYRRLRRFLAHGMRFRVVIVDECHHAAADTYRTVLGILGFLPLDSRGYAPSYVDDARMRAELSVFDRDRQKAQALLLGFTATPNRSDSVGLGCVFDEIVYSYALRQAIADGWLTPMVAYAIETAESLDDVKTTAGDFNQKQLAASVNTPARNRLALAAWQDKGEGRKTLGFTVDVQHAYDLAALFVEAGIKAEAISGKTPKEERRAILRRFADPDSGVAVLFNAMLLTEGTDIPIVSCILHCKPTKSATLYEQMCLDSETEILGEQGWIGIDDDITGKVAAFDLRDGTVRWSDAPRIERPRGGEQMWGIESPHLSIRVTGGHRMVVKTRHSSSWHIKPAESLPSEVKVPVCGLMDVPDADLSDDDLAFLGLLLTDGSLSRANGSISFFQSDRNPSVVDLIDRTLENIGVKYTRSVNTKPSNFGPRSPLNRWTVSRGQPRGRDAHLRGWGYLGRWVSKCAKRLTPAYETLSRRQVAVLLAAMHAGDGLKRRQADWKSGSLSICANVDLADQVQSLCVRRGFRCNVSPRTPRLSMLHISMDRQDWSIVRKASDDRPVWAVVPSEPSERVWCVTVSTGAIITRRRGKVAVVGNTGRGLRLYPGKADCIVIDMVDLSRKHSLQTTPTLMGLPPGLIVNGEDLDDVEADLAALRDEYPGFDVDEALAKEHLTLDALKARAVRVNVFKVEPLGPFGDGRRLAWVRDGDIYRVGYTISDTESETVIVRRNLLGRWDVVVAGRRKMQGGHWHRAEETVIAANVLDAASAGAVAEGFIEHRRPSIFRMKAINAGWRSRPVTPGQAIYLAKLGINPRQAKNSGEASDLIDRFKSRRPK